MILRGNIQNLVHWFEAGPGRRWLQIAAVFAGVLALSLIVAWRQFHGPASEWVLTQADMGRQLSEGKGFSTLVNHPQTAALLKSRGLPFDINKAYPDLHHAPLYPLLIAAPLSLMPKSWTSSLFGHIPSPPDGFGGDYYLLALNLLLLWLAAGLTYDLGNRLFGTRTGIVATLALLLSVSLWKQVVLVNGAMLDAVLVLAAFRVLYAVERRSQEQDRLWLPGTALLGLLCGLLFLTDYTAGALLPVVCGFLILRHRERRGLLGAGIVCVLALAIVSPWLIRNAALSGNPLGLAWQQLVLKADDPTARPEAWRASFTTESPSMDPQKLANKVLTQIQHALKQDLWAGGALFLTAFFIAGLLYRFRSEPANVLRWTFAASLLLLVLSYATFNSGESERLPVVYLSPLMLVFGTGFFFVLVDSSPSVNAWPKLMASCLLIFQALPLLHDALEPRRVHFHYPPYFPSLFVGLRQELELRGIASSHAVVADVPAGVAWYGRQRTWMQPARLRDLYAIALEQPIAELLLSSRSLDRPFFSELSGRPILPAQLAAGESRFGEWNQIYSGLAAGRLPAGFSLSQPHKMAENLYVLVDPGLPLPRKGK